MNNNYNIKITLHAVKRAKTRFNWSKNLLFQKAIESLNSGLLIINDEFLTALYRQVTYYNPHSFLYYYEGIVFVFDEDKLVTVYPLMKQI